MPAMIVNMKMRVIGLTIFTASAAAFAATAFVS
jgi:hypothetical protein